MILLVFIHCLMLLPVCVFVWEVLVVFGPFSEVAFDVLFTCKLAISLLKKRELVAFCSVSSNWGHYYFCVYS